MLPDIELKPMTGTLATLLTPSTFKVDDIDEE
jgi:hypothetical protein